MKKNLKLNTLSRFSKRSPNLVLEEHNHCEVPAGCGGVVLRWINPQREIPLRIDLFLNGKVAQYLDGEKLMYRRPLVEIGRHTLAFEFIEFKPAFGLLMFVSSVFMRNSTDDEVQSNKTNVRLISTPDGSWKYTLSEPHGDSWLYNGFDDSSWLSMVEKPLPFSEKEKREEGFDKWEALGAKQLGIQENRVKKRSVWIRKEFSLSVEGIL